MSSLITFFTDPPNSLTSDRKIFSDRRLGKLIIPLFIEQFLAMLVGVVDTMMVSYAGDAAVSGVSLVNQYNTIFIYIFSALAAGGAVVVSQYIGRGQKDGGDLAAGQLITFSFLLSAGCMILTLIFYRQILELLFGRVDNEVMQACVTYILVSAFSYPGIALYNSGAAIYRSMGRTDVTMYVSFGGNLVNVVGNAIGIFALHMGVLGVAVPTLIARLLQAVVMVMLCFRKNEIALEWRNILIWKDQTVRRILNIAVPNGVENGIFQLVKVGLSSIVALFGTAQIAANGVAQTLWSMSSLMCIAFSLSMLTVLGQCMGAGDPEAAEYYIKKMTRLTVLFSVLWNGFNLAITPALLKLYALSHEAGRYTLYLVIIHNIFNGLMLPLGNCIGNGIRAAGDVRFAMMVSISTTLGVRVVFSIIFGLLLGWGVMGVAAAMCLEWTVKGLIFVGRLRSGKWKYFRVIEPLGEGDKAYDF